MLIAARRGNRLHAPENTLTALVSAWTAGAEVLALEVRLTRDGQIVVAADPTTDRLTGRSARISELSLDELLERDYDISVGFPDGGGYRYRDTGRSPNRAVRHEPFVDLLDDLPPQAPLPVVVADDSGRGAELTQRVVAALAARDRLCHCLLFGGDPALVVSLRQDGAPRVGVEGSGRTPAEQRDLLDSSGADALLTSAHQVFDGQGGLTEWGQALAARHDSGQLALGVVLRADSGVPSADLLTAAAGRTFVWACLTDSMLAVDDLRSSRVLVASDFTGGTVDRRRFAFGYAKPHADTRVWQDNGVHVEVTQYQGPIQLPSAPGVEGRVSMLEE